MSADQAFANGYSAGYAAGRRSAGATGSLQEQTKADEFRSLSDEELAEKVHCLYAKLSCGLDPGLLFCDGKAGCITEDGSIKCNPDAEKACILRWLKSPAKEDRP